MPGTLPTIDNPTPPGGQLYGAESGLPTGSNPGGSTTYSSWTFTISAPDGVGDLTVAGYKAISGGVFTAGSADLGFGRLGVTSYDAATGKVRVDFTLTGTTRSAPGTQMRYGEIFTYAVLLTDRDGDTANSSLIVQLRDDETVRTAADSATVTAGGAASGNLAANDLLSADGFGGLVRVNSTVLSGGATTVEGRYGTLTVNSDGGWTYAARGDAPAGSVDAFGYAVRDGDGDQGANTLEITVQAKAASAAPTAGDDQMTGTSLLGGAGNDTLTGTDGKDYLRGEDGDDRLVGGDSFDDLHGNQGNDTVMGGLGDDWVVGGQGSDQLWGEAGWDVVLGNLGNDTIEGGEGGDWVRGGQGDDVVRGGAGDDFVAGDRGDDTLTGGAGADRFHTFGDAGLDRITDFNFAEGDRLNLMPGSNWTASQVGADVHVGVSASGTAGAQVVLVGVQLSTLTDGWVWIG